MRYAPPWLSSIVDPALRDELVKACKKCDMEKGDEEDAEDEDEEETVEKAGGLYYGEKTKKSKKKLEKSDDDDDDDDDEEEEEDDGSEVEKGTYAHMPDAPMVGEAFAPDWLIHANALAKAQGHLWKPYTGPGKRTGKPGDYSYDYDGDKKPRKKRTARKLSLKPSSDPTDGGTISGRKEIEGSKAEIKKLAAQSLEKDDLSPKQEKDLVARAKKGEGPLAGYNLDVVGDDIEVAAEIAAKLKAGIDKAADVCKIHPPVCAGNLGIPRSDMPQILDKTISEQLKAVDHEGKPDEDERIKARAAIEAGADPNSKKSMMTLMLDHMKSKGIKVADGGGDKSKLETVHVGQLKATQKDIKAKKTTFFADRHLKGKWPGGATADMANDPIIISSDNHILDGHHRWAALTSISGDRTMKVIRVDMPMKELLAESMSLPGVFRMDIDNNVQRGKGGKAIGAKHYTDGSAKKPDYAAYYKAARENAKKIGKAWLCTLGVLDLQKSASVAAPAWQDTWYR